MPAFAGIAAAAVLAGSAAAWFLSGDSHEVPPTAPQVAQQAATPAVPLPAQVAVLPCSTVTVTTESGVTSFQGIIGSGPPHDALDGIIAQVPASSAAVAVQTFPYADLSCRTAELVRTYAGDTGARLSASGGRTVLYTNEDIRLRLNMPNFEGEIRLEDLNSEGLVGHLMEANVGSLPRHRPGAMIGLGRGGDDLIGRVSPPYGTDLLVAIVSSEPLLTGRRPMEEAGGRFIEELDAAMAALRRRGGHVAADALVLTTVRR
jgi:hypothetical protein